jgi:surface antigen
MKRERAAGEIGPNYRRRGRLSLWFIGGVLGVAPLAGAQPIASPSPADEAAANLAAPLTQLKLSIVQPPGEAALPQLPFRPELGNPGYPGCRDEFQAFSAIFDRVVAINRCTNLLDRFYENVLLPYRERMIGYQEELVSVFVEQVASNPAYSNETRRAFYAGIIAEQSSANPDGELQEKARQLEATYRAERQHMQDRYCFHTGCGAYAAPAYVAPRGNQEKTPAPERQERGEDSAAKADQTPQPCKKKSRNSGRIIGGILGFAGGQAAGLDLQQSFLAGTFVGLLGGEIACQLTKEEQQQAEAATQAVAKTETIGETVRWASETRPDVSGSSTIAALNSEPNGRTCLSIVDVAIVEGIETKVSKQMCRGAPGQIYSLVA